MKHITSLAAIAVTSIHCTLACAAAADTPPTYPIRPIRIIAPYAPGGTTDILSRILGVQLTQSLGQQVVVDNRSGGGGTIGSDIVAKGNPDGYTLLVTPSGSHTANPSLYRKLPYDTVRDFAAEIGRAHV